MRILALTHRLPYAPNRGDRIRSFHILRSLAAFADVHLFSLTEPEDERHVPELERWLSSVTTAVPPRLMNFARGAVTLPGSTPLTHTLLSAPGAERQLEALAKRIQPDVVFAYCTGVAKFVVDGPLAAVPCVLDMVDVDSLKWDALSRTSPVPMRWVYRRESRLLRRFEARAAVHARATLVVNRREAEALAKIAPDATIEVVENGIDTTFFAQAGAPADEPTIIFCGVMDYPPNIEAVTWFADQVFPALRRVMPDASFWIVGARPAASVERLATLPGIRVTGAVDDVRPYLSKAWVSVAPLFTARGLQNKVLEALAAGLPAVTTPAVADGLPPEALPGCRVVADAPAFQAAVLDLLRQSPEERLAVSRKADLSSLTWKARLIGLPAMFHSAAATTMSSVR